MKRKILATTTHHKGWKINFQFLYYTLFSDCFSVLFVMIQREFSEIRGTEWLFIDIFGHDVQ